MGHDYNYRVDGSQLAPHADIVRLSEGLTGTRAQLVDTAYRHGVHVAQRHWSTARLARLETRVRLGQAADHHAAKSGLAKLLLGRVAALQRNDPEHGEVQTEILCSDPVEHGVRDERFNLAWPIWVLRGAWEDADESSHLEAGLGTSGSFQIITGGDHPTEPIFDIECTSDGVEPRIKLATDADSEVRVAASFEIGQTATIDVVNRRLLIDGVRNKTAMVINRAWWMELVADSTLTFDWEATSGVWDVTTRWRNRYR